MTTYSRSSPFLAKLKSIELLTKPGSLKRTWHLVVDISGSGIAYEPGDSLGILPKNNPEYIASIISSLGCDPDCRITEKRSGRVVLFRTFLEETANISRMGQKLCALIKAKAIHPQDVSADHHLWDALTTHPVKDLTPQELADTLPQLLPRLYSIASSPKLYPDEIHLTVTQATYTTLEQERHGICTHALSKLFGPDDHLPIYLQKTKDFRLPSPETPIIMIGPGTGVAPFRAFVQERPDSKNWLFFGEQHRATEFYYEEEWAKTSCKLSLAFSRDQEAKIYVQNRMWEERDELWKWLEEGAAVYVCGDAERMAADVEKTLLNIAQDKGHDAEIWLKDLKSQHRYLKDVY